MNVLVAYATRAGATAEIAGRIADRLRATGLEVDLASIAEADRLTDVPSYDAFVVGSAVYVGHWEKAAVEFVREHETVLAFRPTWLFSSGPLGVEPTDAEGRDKREVAVPQEIAPLTAQVHARDHHVFFGALRPDRLGLMPRLMRLLPAGRALLEEGDFRDWADIDGWADEIAHELAGHPVAVGV